MELTGKVFLAGPLQLRAGVALVVDRGTAAHYGSDHVAGAGVMGDGVIDGRGGAKLIGTNVSWWDLAQEAKVKNLNQSVPRILMVAVLRPKVYALSDFAQRLGQFSCVVQPRGWIYGVGRDDRCAEDVA